MVDFTQQIEYLENSDKDKFALKVRQSYLNFMNIESDSVSGCSDLSECCAKTLDSTHSQLHAQKFQSVQSHVRLDLPTDAGPAEIESQSISKNFNESQGSNDKISSKPKSIYDKFRMNLNNTEAAPAKGTATGAIRKKKLARNTCANENQSLNISKEKLITATEQSSTYRITAGIPKHPENNLTSEAPNAITENIEMELQMHDWESESESNFPTKSTSLIPSTSTFQEMIDFPSLGTKRIKITPKPPTLTPPEIPIKNYYGVLSNLETPEGKTTEKPINSKPQTQKSKLEKIPPILLAGHLQDYGSFIKLLRELLGHNNFHVAFNSSNVKILLKSKEDHLKVTNKFKSDNQEFITYPHRDERVKKLVLKAAPKMKTEDIIDELYDVYEIETISVVPMKGRSPVNFSYLVTFPYTVNLADIYKIDGILNLKIKWERYIRKTEYTQCHKCQQFGHTQSFCNMRPKCVKCALDHLTAQCPHTERMEEPKCANCNGAHTASYTQCPKLLTYLENRNENMNRRNAQNKSQSQPNQTNRPTQNRPPATRVKPGTSYADMAQGKKAQNNPTQTQSNPTNDMDDFKTLMQEVRELNEMCNIKNMIDMIRRLKSDLASAKTNLDRINILLQYSEFSP